MACTGLSQAEYGIRIRVAASQEYVNTYSPCRLGTASNGGLQLLSKRYS